MSTFLDIQTGRFFNTRAELLAFQRGEAKASPLSVSEEKVEVKEPEEKKEVKVDETGTITVTLSVEEMKARLKEIGVDGRSLGKKDDEGIAKMYAAKFS